MSKQDLKNQLLDHLYKNGEIRNAEVKSLLGVSLSTVRRLAIELEQEELVTRVPGGIQLGSNSIKYLFSEKELVNAAQKKAIADYVAKNFIQDADIIYLDSGTTVKQLAIAISKRIVSGQLKKLTVITHSLANLEILNDHCDVILIGGSFREPRKDFAGHTTERFLECFYYPKAFLGADGFDINLGYSGNDPLTVAINKTVIERSTAAYVLIDSSKLLSNAFISYAKAAQVKLLITDHQAKPESIAQLDEMAINYCLVEP